MNICKNGQKCYNEKLPKSIHAEDTKVFNKEELVFTRGTLPRLFAACQ